LLNKKKIINDPVYGFITIPHDILFDCIQLPEFQRLRRIKQLGLTHLVYPGALHTRFHHALGAMHLMFTAIETLRTKGVEISEDEEKGVLLAILLHDIGHGPFSHSLENSIFIGVHHEAISSILMQRINKKTNGALNLAIEIFEDRYERKFLHQLVSSQLDMDRLDYLRRDSFYTGVSEGMVGIERIIQMLNVRDNALILDEKGLFSVEKFLMARRFMYWQVYLHKTSISADQMLLQVLKRAKELALSGVNLFASPYLQLFLESNFTVKDLENEEVLNAFCMLDDNDIISALKVWIQHPDKVLSTLCSMLINRELLRIKVQNKPATSEEIETLKTQAANALQIDYELTSYFVYSGKIENNTYSHSKDALKIGLKGGGLRQLADLSEIYPRSETDSPRVKYYICSLK
jgi:HD superfamily phosphohydrolase